MTSRVEEAYLRDDLSCGAAVCRRCPPTSPALAANVRCYVIPDACALLEYLEIFERLEIPDNVIIASSVARQARASCDTHRGCRLGKVWKDRRRACVLFDDVHHAEIAELITSGMLGKDVTYLLEVADWFYKHLNEEISVMVVSDALASRFGSAAFSRRFANETAPGVHILSPKDYFHGLPVDEVDIACVFDSLRRCAEVEKQSRFCHHERETSDASWQPHISYHDIEPGLNGGVLVKGVLKIAEQNPDIGILEHMGQAQIKIVIPGRQAMNRALHGDLVVARLIRKTTQSSSKPTSKTPSSISAGTDNELDLASKSCSQVLSVPLNRLPRCIASGNNNKLDDQSIYGYSAGVTSILGAADDFERVDNPDDSMDDNLGGLGAAYCQATSKGILMGEIVFILHRSSKEIVACIAAEAVETIEVNPPIGNGILCYPFDKRFPPMKLMSQCVQALLNSRVVVRVCNWDIGSHSPDAVLLRVLGPFGGPNSDTDAILAMHGITYEPFQKAALQELPFVETSTASHRGWRLSPEQEAKELSSGRQDLRGEEYFVVSIDPLGCKDVDDAMHVRFLDVHRIEVGVHIADVSWFVHEGSALDAEAAARCTTVYLVDRRLDMLPAELSEDAASLLEKKDRLAVSVIWTIRAEALLHHNSEMEDLIENIWFGRTLIHSRYQLEYQQAQDIVDGKTDPLEKVQQKDIDRLASSLRVLNILAELRRNARSAAGAVELESAEFRFETNPEGQPVNASVKHEIPMMKTVAEMMIMANEAVAKRLYRAFPKSALLRRHDRPNDESTNTFLELCRSFGLSPELQDQSDTENSKDQKSHKASDTLAGPMMDEEYFSRSFGTLIRSILENAPSGITTLLRSSATRLMSEARYFCPGGCDNEKLLGHFGLGLELYTHFTSPIRRYADVMVHRQLLTAISLATSTEGKMSSASGILPPLGEICERVGRMNERHRAAKRAQKHCSEYYLFSMLEVEPCIEHAIVLGAENNPDGFPVLVVFIPRFHIQTTVRLTEDDGQIVLPLKNSKEQRNEHHPGTGLEASLCIELLPWGKKESVQRNMSGHDPRMHDYVSQSKRTMAVATNRNTNEIVRRFEPLQQIWIELGAEKSRGTLLPALKVILLDSTHPAVRDRLQKTKSRGKSSTGSEKTHGSSKRASCDIGTIMEQLQNASLVCHSTSSGSIANAAVQTNLRRRNPPPGFDQQFLHAKEASAIGIVQKYANLSELESIGAVAKSKCINDAQSRNVSITFTGGKTAKLIDNAQSDRLMLVEKDKNKNKKDAYDEDILRLSSMLVTLGTGSTSVTRVLIVAAIGSLRARAARYSLRSSRSKSSVRSAYWKKKACSCRQEVAELVQYLCSEDMREKANSHTAILPAIQKQ